MVNGDIKVDNMVFVTKAGGTDFRLFDRAQITDFTLAVKLADDLAKVHSQRGTRRYFAPEKT